MNNQSTRIFTFNRVFIAIQLALSAHLLYVGEHSLALFSFIMLILMLTILLLTRDN